MIIIPEWADDDDSWMRGQLRKQNLTIMLLEHANEDLEKCAKYWRNKSEGAGGDSSPTPSEVLPPRA